MGLLLSPSRVLLALLLTPAALDSQVLPTELHSLPPESDVRLELAGGEILRGRLSRQDPVSVTIRRINRERGHPAFLEHRPVALDSVVRSWKYAGNHWPVGAAVGATVGVFAMTAFVASPNSHETTCSAGCWIMAEGFGLVVGGGIGYLVGHAVPKWQPLGSAP